VIITPGDMITLTWWDIKGVPVSHYLVVIVDPPNFWYYTFGDTKLWCINIATLSDGQARNDFKVEITRTQC